MAQVAALSADDITTVGIAIIVALVVIGALLSLVISALLGRVIILVVVVGLAFWVWQQRTHVKDQINSHKCDLNATFFGFHLDAPDSVTQACRQHT